MILTMVYQGSPKFAYLNSLIVLLLAYLASSCFSIAQQIRWEYRQGGIGLDRLNDIVRLGDSTYIAFGMRAQYRHDTLPGSLPNVAILRIGKNGDTLFVRNLDMYVDHASSRICSLSTGEVFIIGTGQDILFNSQLQMGQIDPSTGQLVGFWVLPGFGRAAITIKRIIEGPDNTLIFCGIGPDTGSSANIGYVARYDRQGNLLWRKVIREHPNHSFCNWIEATAWGSIIVSGAAGSRIWAAELTADSGREIRRATFYQSSSSIFFDETAAIMQVPGDRYLVYGTIQTSPGTFYLGLHQGWAGPKHWGGETQGYTQCMRVNLDGGIVYQRIWGVLTTLNRLRSDSSIVWSTGFNYPPRSQGSSFYAFASVEEDSGAIGVGIEYYTGFQREDWYAARITNMGIPYDPSQFVSAKPALTEKPYAYPTPCSESLGFSGLLSPAKLEMMDVQGRVVLATEIVPDRMVDVSALVPGLYQYMLTSTGRQDTGRVMKE